MEDDWESTTQETLSEELSMPFARIIDDWRVPLREAVIGGNPPLLHLRMLNVIEHARFARFPHFHSSSHFMTIDEKSFQTLFGCPLKSLITRREWRKTVIQS